MADRTEAPGGDRACAGIRRGALHGAWTYVTENKKVMENPLLLLTSVGTMIKDAGYQAGSVFRSTTHELPTGHIQRKMGLTGDEKIVVVNRARTADFRAAS